MNMITVAELMLLLAEMPQEAVVCADTGQITVVELDSSGTKTQLLVIDAPEMML